MPKKHFESIAGIAKTDKSLVKELLEERAREKEREDAKFKKIFSKNIKKGKINK